MKPTDAELDILQILWRQQPCTVREVNDILNETRPVGYTTTLKIMQLMAIKGMVSRDTSSRTHLYSAAVDRSVTQRTLLDRLTDKAFGGSAKQLILSALGHQSTTPEELAEIRRLIDELEQQNHK